MFENCDLIGANGTYGNVTFGDPIELIVNTTITNVVEK